MTILCNYMITSILEGFPCEIQTEAFWLLGVRQPISDMIRIYLG